MRALHVAIGLIEREGLAQVWERHRRLALAVRAGVQALGLELYAKDLERAYAVTAVKAPAGIDGGDIVRTMNRKYGVVLVGGQGDLKGKIFRIGHVGYYDFFDVLTTISALEQTLGELGYACEPGAGLAAAERANMELC
jgi:aspartate aminotransferase-like enzyme